MIVFESSQWIAVRTASTYKITLSSLVVPAIHAFCSSSSLVSRITALVSAVARATALVSSVARVTALVLLVVVIGGIVLRIMPHLLTVVEVLAFGLDELVGFPGCETGDDVFGHGVILGDTCYQTRRVSNVAIGLDGARVEESLTGRVDLEVGPQTIGFLVLLVLPHSFHTCGTGKHFVGEAALVIGLRPILSVDVLVGLRSVV